MNKKIVLLLLALVSLAIPSAYARSEKTSSKKYAKALARVATNDTTAVVKYYTLIKAGHDAVAAQRDLKSATKAHKDWWQCAMLETCRAYLAQDNPPHNPQQVIATLNAVAYPPAQSNVALRLRARLLADIYAAVGDTNAVAVVLSNEFARTGNPQMALARCAVHSKKGERNHVFATARDSLLHSKFKTKDSAQVAVRLYRAFYINSPTPEQRGEVLMRLSSDTNVTADVRAWFTCAQLADDVPRGTMMGAKWHCIREQACNDDFATALTNATAWAAQLNRIRSMK